MSRQAVMCAHDGRRVTIRRAGARVRRSTGGLGGHAQLVTKVYFPREILPLSYVAAALFDLLVGSVVLVALLAWYGRPVTWQLLFAVPVIATTAMFATALAFMLSALQVWFRDIGLVVPLVVYLWMFCTPVAYPLSAVPERYMTAFQLNPMTGIIETFRDVILRPGASSPALPIVSTLTAVVLLPIAYGVFKRAEATMADVV